MSVTMQFVAKRLNISSKFFTPHSPPLNISKLNRVRKFQRKSVTLNGGVNPLTPTVAIWVQL